mgnify:CR=1 FL=1
MRYAIDDKGNKIEVFTSGQLAYCICCNSKVKGRKGFKNIPHWYHVNKNECDTWYEPITQWHLEWQNIFPESNREVSLYDKENNVYHRADIRLDNGLVIEIQNSNINVHEIQQREDFYSKNGLIWILNGKTLTSRSSIEYKYVYKDISISVVIPDYVENDLINDYSFDDVNEKFRESNSFISAKNHVGFLKYSNQNGNYHYFEFNQFVSFVDLKISFTNDLRNIYKTLYGVEFDKILINKTEFQYNCIEEDHYKIQSFDKKYWRTFIDEFKCPVYIDNLPGLASDLLYSYQENKIYTKDAFLNEILKK